MPSFRTSAPSTTPCPGTERWRLSAASDHSPLQTALLRTRDDAAYRRAVLRNAWAVQQAAGLTDGEWAQVVAVAAALEQEVADPLSDRPPWQRPIPDRRIMRTRSRS